MSPLVFVDTNVFIYARDPGDPRKQAAAMDWFSRLWKEQTGRTSVQVLSEFYANITRKLARPPSAEDAWNEVRTFLAWRPHPFDPALMERAREVQGRWRLNWWDCAVVAAAQAQGCAILLTEDLQDGAAFGSVTVRNPFALRASEPVTSYQASPVVANRHRGRGRPRKTVVSQ